MKLSCAVLLIVTAGLSTGFGAPDAPALSTRHGLFNGLDSQSIYGQGYFPEPFLVDDSDLEPGEARLDWAHREGKGSRSDEVKAEVEKSFGLLTLELEVPWERDNGGGMVMDGVGNIDVGARYPFFQWVSSKVDSTSGAAAEVGIPTHSSVSKNGELVPKIFNDTKIGNFTVQSIAGYSVTLGPADNERNLEYGFVFGYPLPHRQWLPGVEEVIPMLELTGETGLNKAASGHTSLTGDAGVRLLCRSIGQVQPRLGIAFVFPVNNHARADTHWGVVTSLVFQY